MDRVASVLFSLPMLNAEPSMVNGGWDFTPTVTFAAVVMIIGFAVVAAGWAIRRDV